MPDTTPPLGGARGDNRNSVVAFPRTHAPERLPPNNLPLQLSSFVGREREIAEAKDLLAKQRLLTLTGPGGCGKTRLALNVAGDLVERFEDGVWLVELASLSHPKLVAGALASALGVREAPDRSLTEVLVDHLEPRKTLLVLDNCEHLIEGCAVLADVLLRACPHLKILATSREPLRIDGEASWVVPSLSMPDPRRLPPTEELARYEAVRLFVERAKAVDVGFALTERNASAVTRLCHKLVGIPLAIELAAARARVLTVEQISEKLEDPLGLLTTGSRTAARRHQTLRAALGWSYELLSEPERKLFGRLSVFAGGWALEAAEAVGAAKGIHAEEVLDLLCRLVEQSLVVAETGAVEGVPRYRMLEPVRQYALELLEHGREADDVRGRHAALFVALAEQAHPELRGPNQVKWMHRLGQENDNLRAAIAWALSTGEAETAARLGWALWPFWWYRGNHREGRRLVEAALEGEVDLPLELRIRANVSAEIMAYGQADNEAVVRYAGELVELSRQVGRNLYAEAYANAGLGLVALNRGDFEKATTHLEEALPLFLESGEVWTAAQTHTWLGTVLLLQGDRDRAVPRFEKGLALAREIGDRTGIYNALYTLAQVALVRGEHELATSSFREGMGLSEEMGDRANVAYCLEGLATVAAGAQCKAERSARLFGAAHGLLETIGVPVWTFYKPDRSLYERTIADLRVRLDEAVFEAAWTEGRAMSPEQAIEYALGGRTEEPPAAATPTTVTAPIAPEPPAGSSEKPPKTAEVETTTTAGLRVFALRPARVEKGGRPLASSPDWILKPRELLFYLLSHPEGRTKEQIGLALWPDASTAQLRSSFHDTVFRLRRALGDKEWVVFEKGRYAFNRSLNYFFDVEAFKENLSEGRRLRSEAPEQAVWHLEKAADLYRGDFLEDFAESEWAMERQEELWREHQGALLLLGGLLFAQGRHAEAAEAYRKAVAHDRLQEEAHRELMRCYAALGERGRALKHYEDLVELLEEELGARPAPETRAFYERLRADEEV